MYSKRNRRTRSENNWVAIALCSLIIGGCAREHKPVTASFPIKEKIERVESSRPQPIGSMRWEIVKSTRREAKKIEPIPYLENFSQAKLARTTKNRNAVAVHQSPKKAIEASDQHLAPPKIQKRKAPEPQPRSSKTKKKREKFSDLSKWELEREDLFAPMERVSTSQPQLWQLEREFTPLDKWSLEE